MDDVDFLELYHKLGLSKAFLGLTPESVKVIFTEIPPPKKFSDRVCDMHIDRHRNELDIEVHDTDRKSAEKVIVAVMAHATSDTFSFARCFIASILITAALFFTSFHFSMPVNENGIVMPIYEYMIIGMSVNLVIQVYMKYGLCDVKLRHIVDDTRTNMHITGIYDSEDEIILYSSPFIDKRSGWEVTALSILLSILMIVSSLLMMSDILQ